MSEGHGLSNGADSGDAGCIARPGPAFSAECGVGVLGAADRVGGRTCRLRMSGGVMRAWWLAVVLVTAACADEIPEEVTEQMEAARAANEAVPDSLEGPDPNDLLVRAPAGGHADWIRDIRVGLDTVPAQSAVDRGAALHVVQELYSRRFEPLRIFYGNGGAANAGPQLAQAVEHAGTRMQELMRLLAGNEADTAAIEEAVRVTKEALDAIESAAQAAGLPPSAPRPAGSTIDTTGARDTAGGRPD
ncbi:MAG TPA: hypothetical protein VHG09_06765 [Longimicrobiales bacterium]|nr:hypothetical protein [Longimicrobiales bacterium]